MNLYKSAWNALRVAALPIIIFITSNHANAAGSALSIIYPNGQKKSANFSMFSCVPEILNVTTDSAGQMTKMNIRFEEGIPNGLRCRVSFSGSYLDLGKEVCAWGQMKLLKGVTCRGDLNEYNDNITYDGKNFSFEKANTQYPVPQKCSDFSGNWSGYSDIMKVMPRDDFHQQSYAIRQEGCEKLSVKYLDPNYPENTYGPREYRTDGMPDLKLQVAQFTNENTFEIKEPKMSISSEPYKQQFQMGKTLWGWPSILTEGSYYVKAQPFFQGGPCWSFKAVDLREGLECIASSGVRWKRVKDGWQDLSKGGKTWSAFKESFFNSLHGQLALDGIQSQASVACEKRGLKLPSGDSPPLFQGSCRVS